MKKKTLATRLIAIPLLILSSAAFAAEPDTQGPLLLSAQQMDGVTAGRYVAWTGGKSHGLWNAFSAVYKQAALSQFTISPVTIVQIGNNNSALVLSGNFAWVNQ